MKGVVIAGNLTVLQRTAVNVMSEEVVEGKEVVIRFEAQRCIHSRHCVLDRPDVFVPNVKASLLIVLPLVSATDENARPVVAPLARL